MPEISVMAEFSDMTGDMSRGTAGMVTGLFCGLAALSIGCVPIDPDSGFANPGAAVVTATDDRG
jgi:hypothetical protein